MSSSSSSSSLLLLFFCLMLLLLLLLFVLLVLLLFGEVLALGDVVEAVALLEQRAVEHLDALLEAVALRALALRLLDGHRALELLDRRLRLPS
mmetsp:Transcript_40405/g.129729  ORF Transcript_40405/g.129729 Transcript_40405/m.129729 type:complete len:93 (+) Transcript_40405:2-280(+)